MNDDLKPLGYYSPMDGYTIYVIDTDPNSILSQLDDLSQVEKYMMSDEDYNALPSKHSALMSRFDEKIPYKDEEEQPRAFLEKRDHHRPRPHEGHCRQVQGRRQAQASHRWP